MLQSVLGKISSHFKSQEPAACDLDMTWQQIGGELTVHVSRSSP